MANYDGKPFVPFTGKRPGFNRGSGPPGAPPFGSYSWAYTEAANMLAERIRETYPTLDLMGAPLVFLFRHAMETALKDTFTKLSALGMTESGRKPESFGHDLVKLCNAVEKAIETHIAAPRTINELGQISLNLKAPFQLPDASRQALAELNDKQYPERYPAEKWSKEYDFDKFETECNSVLWDLEAANHLISAVSTLKSGKSLDEPDEF